MGERKAFIRGIYEISDRGFGKPTMESYKEASRKAQSSEVPVGNTNSIESKTRKTTLWLVVIVTILIVLGILTICFVIKNKRNKTKGGII